MELTNLSAEEVGSLVGLSGRRIRQLVDEGRLPTPTVPGRHDAAVVVRALLAEARASRPESDLERARARQIAAKATDQEMRTAERRRELVAVDVATDVIDNLVSFVRSELNGLPAQVTRDMDLRRKLEAAVDGALTRIADRCGEAAAAVVTDLPADEGGDA